MAAPLRTSRMLEPDVAGYGTTFVISGCMFSGKTSALLRQLRTVPPEQCLAAKHFRDGRYARGMIVSHAGQAYPAIGVRAAAEITEAVRPGVTLVALDDAHFLEAGLPRLAADLNARGIDVAVTALDLDSWGRPFPVIRELSARAGRSVRLYSVCARCGQTANRSQRLTPIHDGNLVGGRGDYEPRCSSCWRPPPEPPPVLA